MSVTQVPRNDIAAATAYYEKHKPISMDAFRVLLRLQDDPTELQQIARTWQVQETPERTF